MFWISIATATLCLLISIIIFSLRIGFPYHRGIGVGVYLLGWIPFMYSLFLVEGWILKGGGVMSNFSSPLIGELIFLILLFVVMYGIYKIFLEEKPNIILDQPDDIQQTLIEDQFTLEYLDKRFGELISIIEARSIFTNDFMDVLSEDKDSLRSVWSEYLDTVFEIELIYNKYASLRIWDTIRGRGIYSRVFINKYSALVLRHYSMLAWIKKVKDKNLITYLNQPVPGKNIHENTFDGMRESVGNPYEVMKLAEGRIYYYFLKRLKKTNFYIVDKYLVRLSESIKGHSKLLAKRPFDFLEQQSSRVWSPIIKNTALGVSYIRTSDRPYHITREQIDKAKNLLLPGDVLLERREWHAVNIGIPGFWTHVAIYLGDLEILDDFFKENQLFSGRTFSQYLATEDPDAYKGLLGKDKDGNPYSVIEAKRPGVILDSLESSAHVDSLALLSVKNLSSEDRLTIVLGALKHLGRPYDYNFDFTTDNAFVCSELVYKAYKPTGKLTLELETLNGRPMVSPNSFVKKFRTEQNSNSSELELLLFLDGDERERVAKGASVDEFVTSADRPKWNALRQLARLN